MENDLFSVLNSEFMSIRRTDITMFLSVSTDIILALFHKLIKHEVIDIICCKAKFSHLRTWSHVKLAKLISLVTSVFWNWKLRWRNHRDFLISWYHTWYRGLLFLVEEAKAWAFKSPWTWQKTNSRFWHLLWCWWCNSCLLS